MDPRNQVVRGLVEDLEIAQSNALLTFHMRQQVHRKTPLARLAEDFMWFVLRASRDNMIIHLGKIYDTQSSARSLRWFVANESAADPTVQQTDLDRLAPMNSDVKRLLRLRHNVFAHRGSETAKNGAGAVLDAHDLSEKEILGLMTVARDILRRHFGDSLPRQTLHRANDAISQLQDLDYYLSDAMRGRWGIERVELEIDGPVRG